MFLLYKLPIDIVEIVITKSKDGPYLFETLQTMIEKLKQKDISDRIKEKLTVTYYEYSSSFRYKYNDYSYRSYDKPCHIWNDFHYFNNRINGQPFVIDSSSRKYNNNFIRDIGDFGYVIYKLEKYYHYDPCGVLNIYSVNYYKPDTSIKRLDFID